VMLAVVLSSCTDAGTLKRVDKGNNEQIEVFEYYYDKGSYVYVARFKVPASVQEDKTTANITAIAFFLVKFNFVIFILKFII